MLAHGRRSTRKCGSNGVQWGNSLCTRDDSSVAEQRPQYGTDMGASGSFYDVQGAGGGGFRG